MNEEFWKRFSVVPGFDCLDMKDRIQATIYEEIEGLSPEERLLYFVRAGSDFRRRGRIEAATEAERSLAKERSATYPIEPPHRD